MPYMKSCLNHDQNSLPTLAGLMLLGEYPQEFFPQLSVTAMVVQGREIGGAW